MQLAEERRQSILDAVEREGRVLAAELAQRLDTSEDTIRRDLRDLDAAGLLRRVHGGAVRRTREASFGERLERDVVRKAALAHGLRDCIRPGDTVLIDAGSTNLAVARLLEDGHAATVVTNSPQVALALGDFRRTRIVLLGGTYHAATGAVLGAWTLAELQQLRADLCIVGVCALDAKRGLAASDAEEATIKAAMVTGSTRRAAAVLNERLDGSAPFAFARLAELDHLVLEADAPLDTIAGLRDAHPALDLRIAAKART
ncbi:DeoR/GlpR family DNA-binding transcription regulator [Massilia sp. IC2-477]|uniref:DeoR/GlpR family DNA-binding transcription regulator n=1 Tax=unclassified Massilia TaxID=2609279 RepID=UPI001D0F6DEC|nr:MULTISPECIES: DeoR/GlpR family DNA-binding transcription regulator [unclassified Massilia]MCC2956955.1 DeoR/GlpR family DNA-binding transcription regulator [Massilia sp. IC2-477]MCC2973375.1 DeoR/GlpR family DNA-binding transcription regulator [Massilia sp. IC2-476]